MASISSFSTRDTTILFLAIFARLCDAPLSVTAPHQRRDTVRHMLKRGATDALSYDALDALTNELLVAAAEFPTFDALLERYDVATLQAKSIARGLDVALVGQVEGMPLFQPHTPMKDFAQISG